MKCMVNFANSTPGCTGLQEITNDKCEKFRPNFSSVSPKMRSLQKESLCWHCQPSWTGHDEYNYHNSMQVCLIEGKSHSPIHSFKCSICKGPGRREHTTMLSRMRVNIGMKYLALSPVTISYTNLKETHTHMSCKTLENCNRQQYTYLGKLFVLSLIFTLILLNKIKCSLQNRNNSLVIVITIKLLIIMSQLVLINVNKQGETKTSVAGVFLQKS